MKIIIAVAFYLLYWFCCFLGTGTDKKNLLGLRSYPDEVQRIVKNESSLAPYQNPKKHVDSFLRGIPLFAVVAAIAAVIVTLI